MAKTNFSFAKRQRELAKKQKKEEKRLRNSGDPADAATPELTPEPTPEPPPASPAGRPVP
jgi:hypothetical protein